MDLSSPNYPFFSKKGTKKHLFQDQLSFLEGLVWKWSEMMVFIPSFSKYHRQELSHRRGFRFVTFGTCTATWTGQTRMTKNSELMESWLNVEDAQIRFSDWLRARIPGFRWSNPDSGTAGSTESKYRVSQIKFDQCGGTVVEQFGERKHFSSRFTSPKQTAAAGAQQPVVSAVCCRAAVSHLAVLAVFFFFPSFMEKCWCLFLPVPPKLRV